jgi:hypothetical protein
LKKTAKTSIVGSILRGEGVDCGSGKPGEGISNAVAGLSRAVTAEGRSEA